MKFVQHLFFYVLLGAASVAGASEIDSPSHGVNNENNERFSQQSRDVEYRKAVFGSAENFALKATKAALEGDLRSERISHVPEPEGWTMLVLGLGFVLYQIRRRRKKNAAWDIS